MRFVKFLQIGIANSTPDDEVYPSHLNLGEVFVIAPVSKVGVDFKINETERAISANDLKVMGTKEHFLVYCRIYDGAGNAYAGFINQEELDRL